MAREAPEESREMMLDYLGQVTEATGANIFFIKDGVIHTPTPDYFLNGITRQASSTRFPKSARIASRRRRSRTRMNDRMKELYPAAVAAE
nr:aminotransferase class IV [Rhizobium leguminosarum]